MPVLQLRNVEYSYSGRSGMVPAVEGLSLDIEPGSFLSIVGPSGCGKSTLLRLLAGLLFPDKGEVLDEGQQVTGPNPRRGIVFQKPQLYPWLTVGKNVEFGPKMRGLPRAERKKLAAQYVEMVRLTEFAKSYPYELSGGMQQRAALARVLANDPKVLLMDEPFGALDALTREHLQDELREIWRSTGKTIVLVTHSVEEAVYLGTRVLILSDRPARTLADIPVKFSTNGTRGLGREVKARPEFIQVREEVLRYVWT
ncbi:MAG: ABC transporter ATP-binding protein [Spirochaeta sp.]|nr:ABC transporter ATP-binding protein [Spirochaeta sp.]